MIWLYEILLHLALPLVFPFLLVRKHWRRRLTDRTGDWPPLLYERLHGGRVIWTHCASVGEVNAARPLLECLFDLYPDHRFLVTTMTVTGLERAEQILGKRAAMALLPIDSQFFLRRVFRQVRPALLLVFETELWPQFLRMAKASGAKIALVNGRISHRSYPRYRAARFFFSQIWPAFDAFLMGGEESARRIIDLGADASKVKVLGNVKWAGRTWDSCSSVRVRWPADALVIVAGSTHEGEEAAVLDAFEDVRQYYPQARLVLAPRHLPRIEDILRLLARRGCRYVRRSSLALPTLDLSACDILLLDTVGELAAFYRGAAVAFVGGSFVPVGGHNMLEPAAEGVPVLYGPHVQNFADIAACLEQEGAALRVTDWQDLAKGLRRLFSDPSLRERMGRAGSRVVAKQADILQRYQAEVMALLGAHPSKHERQTI